MNLPRPFRFEQVRTKDPYSYYVIAKAWSTSVETSSAASLH